MTDVLNNGNGSSSGHGNSSNGSADTNASANTNAGANGNSNGSSNGVTTPTESREARVSALDDHYQTLMVSLQNMGFGGNGQMRTVGVTSARRKEGVTTVVKNLAISLATYTDDSILVIDANSADPQLHNSLHGEQTAGFSDAIQGEKKWEDVVQVTELPNVSLIAAGEFQGRLNFAENAIRGMHTLCQKYKWVLVDLPSATAGTHLATLTSQLDGVLFVVEAERGNEEVSNGVAKRLTDIGANLLGVVFNKRRNHLPRWLSPK